MMSPISERALMWGTGADHLFGYQVQQWPSSKTVRTEIKKTPILFPSAPRSLQTKNSCFIPPSNVIKKRPLSIAAPSASFSSPLPSDSWPRCVPSGCSRCKMQNAFSAAGLFAIQDLQKYRKNHKIDFLGFRKFLCPKHIQYQ